MARDRQRGEREGERQEECVSLVKKEVASILLFSGRGGGNTISIALQKHLRLKIVIETCDLLLIQLNHHAIGAYQYQP